MQQLSMGPKASEKYDRRFSKGITVTVQSTPFNNAEDAASNDAITPDREVVITLDAPASKQQQPTEESASEPSATTSQLQEVARTIPWDDTFNDSAGTSSQQHQQQQQQQQQQGGNGQTVLKEATVEEGGHQLEVTSPVTLDTSEVFVNPWGDTTFETTSEEEQDSSSREARDGRKK